MNLIFDIIYSFIKAFYTTLIDVCIDIFAFIVNALFAFVSYLITLMATIMPSLSLGVDLIKGTSPHTAICWLNWLFPVDVLFQCTQFYIALYILKFMSNPILRFLNIVR